MNVVNHVFALFMNLIEVSEKRRGEKMDIALEVIGVISIVVGAILTITILGITIGIPTLIDGIVLFAIGATYRAVKDIQKKIK